MLNISHVRLQTWALSWAWLPNVPPTSCLSPFSLLQGEKSGSLQHSGVTELPRRYLHDLLLSGGATLTAWIAYFDCNETGISPMPNWMGTSRAQQSPAQWQWQTITYSQHFCAQRKSWRLYREYTWISTLESFARWSEMNCWLQVWF